jgi:hypothetical protein
MENADLGRLRVPVGGTTKGLLTASQCDDIVARFGAAGVGSKKF